VKRILFDENLPRLLRRELPELEVRTVQEEGWGSFRNGDLLRRAERTFDVLLTADRRMQYQQKLTSFDIGVVVIVTPRLQLDLLRSAIHRIRAAINTVARGEVIHVIITQSQSYSFATWGQVFVLASVAKPDSADHTHQRTSNQPNRHANLRRGPRRCNETNAGAGVMKRLPLVRHYPISDGGRNATHTTSRVCDTELTTSGKKLCVVVHRAWRCTCLRYGSSSGGPTRAMRGST
jgi:hypothetical protein